MSEFVEKLRICRAESQNLKRGTNSEWDDFELVAISRAIGYSALGGILGSIFALIWVYFSEAKYFSLIATDSAIRGLGWGALLGFLWYCLYPLLSWISQTVLKLRLPPPDFWDKFREGQKILCILLVSWGVTYEINHNYYPIKSYIKEKIETTQKTSTEIRQISRTRHEQLNRYREVHFYLSYSPEREILPLQSNWTWGLAWILVTFSLSSTGERIEKYRKKRQAKKNLANPKELMPSPPLPFRLWFGRSTGQLSKLSHGTGMAANQNIALSIEDAAQNILILGGICSGKTTRAIHPFLIQLLDQKCGGLIFDIKGDFKKAVLSFGNKINHPIIMIGPGHQKMNLISGLTPEVASSFLKSVFLLGGRSHGDSFWVDTATELCRNTLGILSFLPQHYSLQGLYGYLFDLEYRSARDVEINNFLTELANSENDKNNERATKLLKSYWQYQERIFNHFDEKVKASVNATIAQVLSPFNHPELVEAFCSETEEQADMTAVLDGAVYLVSLPLSVWGLGGKVAYSLIKLRFYNVMQQRTTQPEWNQENPAFFMCDEFQEIVSANKDGLSDLNFWDKSRSSKTIRIISAQAISSFYAAIGDRDVAHALLQNFRQKICFRNEDTTTLNYFNYLADKVEVKRKTYSHTTGSQSHPGSIFGSTSKSTTENITLVDKPVLSPQLFRKLSPDYAVALLSVNGHSMDDVIWMMPVYLA